MEKGKLQRARAEAGFGREASHYGEGGIRDIPSAVTCPYSLCAVCAGS